MKRFISALLINLLLSPVAALPASDEALPGTTLLVSTGDPAEQMVDGIHRYLDRQTAESQSRRDELWGSYQSTADELLSYLEKEKLFRKLIGAVDARVKNPSFEILGPPIASAMTDNGQGYRVFKVRWPVFEGVTGEGLLLEPVGKKFARIVAIPDADWSPEMLSGITPGVPAAAQFARKLAELRCEVVIPTVIDRQDTWSGIPGVRMTNQPHREYIYRMAYEVGRHIIGYEVQKILAAIDCFDQENEKEDVPLTAVMGYGEGGLLALYAAVIDHRIDRTVVSGYFQSRQELWKEPIYRNIWGLLTEFSDAELTQLVEQNRGLVVEACAAPSVSGPPPETADRKGATPNGKIETPSLEAIKAEITRCGKFDPGIYNNPFHFVVSDGGHGLPGSNETLRVLLADTAAETLVGRKTVFPALKIEVPTTTLEEQANLRMKRQFDELVEYTQKLVRQSPQRRKEFWKSADASSVERWRESTQAQRRIFWEEVIGRLPDPDLPMNPQTRLIYDEPKFKGYEVKLDVWHDIFAYGILLVPKDIKPGERRPVVVCQHGLEGRASDVADPKSDSPYYHRFASQLAEKGFITFSPQNPYIGKDHFRLLLRKSHPLKLTLFSFIIGQHQRILEWLATLPYVDPARIGFYGLSYGGKTAMRVPTLLDGYALSICSGDFNEWVWKTTSADSLYSYMLLHEYDMYEFNLANTANYAELATMMAPRPFMVERGHSDPVAPDEWVAYEFAKAKRFYDAQMKLPDRCTIEFFDGPHTINGKGTFEFLEKFLYWPDLRRSAQPFVLIKP
ncbi:MAG: hypothetical protein U0V70_14810 [Terriglobia bacterium]